MTDMTKQVSPNVSSCCQSRSAPIAAQRVRMQLVVNNGIHSVGKPVDDTRQRYPACEFLPVFTSSIAARNVLPFPPGFTVTVPTVAGCPVVAPGGHGLRAGGWDIPVWTGPRSSDWPGRWAAHSAGSRPGRPWGWPTPAWSPSAGPTCWTRLALLRHHLDLLRGRRGRRAAPPGQGRPRSRRRGQERGRQGQGRGR